MKTTIAMFMPTLNASSSAARDRLAAEQVRRSAPASCRRRPASPGTASRASRRPARAARCARSRCTCERAQEEVHRRDPEAPTRSPAGRSRRSRKRRRSRRIAKPCATRRAKARAALLGTTTNAIDRRPRATRARGRSVNRSCCDEELPVDARDARVDLVRRQHADRERPDHQRAGDEEVEQRLDDQGRCERRVARASDALLDQVELDHVAAARRRDRVDADARDIRAERAAEAHALRRDRRRAGSSARRGARSSSLITWQRSASREGRDHPTAARWSQEDADGVEEGAQGAAKRTISRSVRRPAAIEHAVGGEAERRSRRGSSRRRSASASRSAGRPRTSWITT